MKVVTGVKAMLAIAVAAVGLAVFAVPSVEITSVRLRDPRDGTVEYRYKVDGEFEEGEYDVLIKVSVANGTKSTVVTHESVAGGRTVSTNLNVQTLFGKAYPNVALFATLEKHLRSVQLWEGGPYWAECNVGAESPEDPGYYFWWGDTVGYVRNESNNGWVSADGKGTVMDFNGNNALSNLSYLKSETDLKNGGWIDANTNLVAKHDAARVHLGRGWRLPTLAEIVRLEKCAGEGATNWKGTGKAGRVIKGTGSCASNSIFLPLTGYGVGPNLNGLTTEGALWTATPTFDAQNHYANKLGFGTGYHGKYTNVDRYIGLPIRAVRDAE